jgi:hypothetical protein
MAAAVVPLFYFAAMKRVANATGGNGELSAMLSGMSHPGFEDISSLLSTVFNRFVVGGLDRFLLVFQSFVMYPPDIGYRLDYLVYLCESTANLVLPGTPFLDAYAPSAQLFPIVVEHGQMGGNYDKLSYLTSLNSQPYTIYGLFIIIFGVLSPPVIFVFMITITWFHNLLKNPLLVIGSIYFFNGALVAYGIDAVIGNTFHLLISMSFLYATARILGVIFSRASRHSHPLQRAFSIDSP